MYGCATGYKDFRSYCFLDKPLFGCPCEEYIEATAFSNRIRAMNPDPNLIVEILAAWDIYDPAELATLSPDKQDGLLYILYTIYDYGDNTNDEN